MFIQGVYQYEITRASIVKIKTLPYQLWTACVICDHHRHKVELTIALGICVSQLPLQSVQSGHHALFSMQNRCGTKYKVVVY